MAIRVIVSPNSHFQNLCRFIRHLNSSSSSITAVPTINFDDKSNSSVTEPPKTTTTHGGVCEEVTSSVLNLGNVKELFSTVSTSTLVKSSAMLGMAAVEPVVDFGTWLMNSRLMEAPPLKTAVLKGVKHTFFNHFCAGEDAVEAGRTAVELWNSGLSGMLDYALEHVDDRESCDRNMKEFIHTVESTRLLPPSSISFVVVKITAICPMSLLKHVSDLLRWEYKDELFHLPWKRKTLPIFSDSSPFYHTPSKPDSLNPQQEFEIELVHERLQKICNKCMEFDTPLLIDAEDTLIQPAIDYFTYSAAILNNDKDEKKPIIFGTIQTYLKDAKERLLKTKKAADYIGIPMGFKLVRGAYMSSENRLASSLCVESPIHNNIQQTHTCYNDCASFMLQEIANGSGAVVLATHNVESGKLAVGKAIELGIKKKNQKLQFAQLYGMADGFSFGLRNAGFLVSKYLPFGPVEQIMPYLLRRAEENRGMLSTSSLDRQLMRKEIIRRLKSNFLR